ncbi:MAG: LBF_2804 family protein [Paracoccaceae bacterium]
MCQTLGAGNGSEITVLAAETFSPEPNLLECKFADCLAQHSTNNDAAGHPSRESVNKINRVTRWIIGQSALAGIISGGLIGGAEIWMRQAILVGMEGAGWRETLPYWAAFYAFAGVISAVEIALLYALALRGVARISQWSGLSLSEHDGRGLFAHALARTALEFPNPQVEIYGIDPYARVANWKLTALNIAYKMKVGVSSFLVRVFLRRVASRVAIRGVVPLLAGPLYAAWNAYITWRILTEAQVRTLGPLAVNNLIAAHFQNAKDLDDTAKDVMLHALAEMVTRGRDAHPNQIYLMARVRTALERTEEIALDWPTMRRHLPALRSADQIRVLDVMTLSCIIGSHSHREQMVLLRSACQDCNVVLHEDRVNELRRSLRRGDKITVNDLSGARSDSR